MRSRPAPATTPSWFVRHGALIAVLVVIGVAAFVRLRLAHAPLERDEGEYAYAGQLILQGVPPYELAYNMKFPGTYYAYAAILAVFGETPWAIRFGLLLVNAASTLLLFRLGIRVLGTASAAAVAAGTFAMLSLDRWVVGTFSHATHFVMLPTLGGLLVLLGAIRSGRAAAFLTAGVLLGVAVLMKQHAAAFVLFAVVFVLRHGGPQTGPPYVPPPSVRPPSVRVRHAALVLGGALVPFAVTCVVLAAQGVLGKFWFWTFDYARAYVSQVPVSNALYNLAFAFGYITRGAWAIWILAGIGLAGLWVVRWPREPRTFMVGLAAASFLALCPGFVFRPHYWVLILPAVALLAGAAVVSLTRLLGTAVTPRAAQAIGVAAAVSVGAHFVITERDWMFRIPVGEVSRALYDMNPFPEAGEIGKYLEAHTTPRDRIAVLGSEPEIYFYSRRSSATGYIYMYALSEDHPHAERMRQEFMREIEDARPAYIVYVPMLVSWMTSPTANSTAQRWAERYARACYDLVGIADVERARTTFVWDAEAPQYRPQGEFAVLTFRRKQDGPCTVPQ